MISVYGSTGFIGGAFSKIFHDKIIKIPRESRKPQSNEILYFISTTTNYNVFDNLHLDIDTNLKVLMEVLEYCKSEDIVFNFISSGFVYGLDIINAKETDNPDPRGFYSITKRSAEQLLISFCETFGCKYRIFRLGNVYGTDKTVSSKKNVLAFLINKLKVNEEIQLYEGGYVLRDYMHVDDVSKAVMHIINEGPVNEIYNIATGQPRYFRDIIELAYSEVSSKSNIVSIDTPNFYKMTQAKNFSLNVEKLKNLNFSPNISIESGIKQLCIN